MIRLARVAVLALTLAACAAPQPRPSAPTTTLPEAWEVHGRLAVRAGGEAWHGRFTWLRDQARQRIELSGPLGQGSVRLRESAAGAVLELGDGHVVRGEDTRALLEQHYGWSLPFEGLSYWIAGQIDPARPGRTLLDDEGLVVGLAQDGWEIALDRYRAVASGSLPHRVILVREGLEVRLAVEGWNLHPGEPG